jgi:hypothetical protein
MKAWWQILAILAAVCLSFGLTVACGDDDDDDDDENDDDDDDDDDDNDGDDDDGATGGDDCESLCDRGFACFGDDYLEFGDIDSYEECAPKCESDMAAVDPTLAECIFGCAGEVGCDDWGSCMAACAGY